MKKYLLLVVCMAFVAAGITAQAQEQVTAPKKSKIPASLKSQAKISPEQARTTAIKKVPGVIQEEELENENGKLVYSYDIKASGQTGITEVQVSAIDGSIVSVEKEDAASEAKEKAKDSAKKDKTASPPQP